MRLIASASELAPAAPVSAAVGVFDGVHLGHREILRRVRDHARTLGGTSLVITFDRHPNAVVAPDRAPLMIAPLTRRLRLLADEGVDATLVLRFDEALSRVGGEEFIRDLARGLGRLRRLTVGEGFTFGHKRGGNVALLRRLGAEMGFEVEAVGGIEHHGERVSSTRIRDLIQTGDLAAAAALLGRPCALCGPVIPGDQLGRKIGFPTANLYLAGFVTPPFGVYAGRTRFRDSTWKVALNIGVRPTVHQPVPQLRVEAHLIDFDGELVGEELEIELLARLRPERKFPDFAALSAQIREDVARTRALVD